LRRLRRSALAARISGTTIDAIAELLLDCTNLGQQCDWIEHAILLAQPLLDGRRRLRMRKCQLTGRRRSVIALDHFRAFAALVLSLNDG
jgi:hypothetical protein